MTNEQIAELRRLEANAAPAPWVVGDEWEITFYAKPENDYQRERSVGKPGYPEAVVQGGEQRGDPAVSDEDAAFIAAARNALPRLLDEREALIQALQTMATHLRRSIDSGGGPTDGCHHDWENGECLTWMEKFAGDALWKTRMP